MPSIVLMPCIYKCFMIVNRVKLNLLLCTQISIQVQSVVCFQISFHGVALFLCQVVHLYNLVIKVGKMKLV